MEKKAKKKYKKLLKGTHSVLTQLVNLKCESSWVSEIGVVALENERLALSVTFVSGVKIAYTWTNDSQVTDWWSDWSEAASKGKYLWAWLYNQPYIYLS